MNLNQALDRIEAIGENHKMIASYYEGEILDYTSSDSARENAFVCTILDGVEKENQFDLRLSLSFFDWCEKNQRKVRNVWSDQLLILQDVVALIRAASNDWDVSSSNRVTFFTESYEDSVSGVQTEIQITFDYEADRCAVPTT